MGMWLRYMLLLASPNQAASSGLRSSFECSLMAACSQQACSHACLQATSAPCTWAGAHVFVCLTGLFLSNSRRGYSNKRPAHTVWMQSLLHSLLTLM